MDSLPSTPHPGIDLTSPEFLEHLEKAGVGDRFRLLSEGLLAFLQHAGALGPDADMDTRAFVESLTAVELNAVLGARFGVEIGLQKLREPVSARELAQTVVEQLDGEPVQGTADTFVPDMESRWEPFGLTDLQQAYLLGRSGYFALGNVPAAFYAEIDAAGVDLDRLEKSWNTVVGRHDMLRTVFTDDGLQQVKQDVPNYRIARHDVRNLTAEEAARFLAAVREELGTRIREPQQWPLFEIAATRLDDERTRIHLAIDLLITDGATLGRLVHEWGAYYLEPGSDLPVPGVSFRDYVRALEKVEESAAFRKAREYWVARVPTLPAAPELPLQQAPEALETPRFSTRSLELDQERWTRLRQRAMRHGLTPSMALCWAYAATLRTWSATDHFTLNVTINDRLPLHPDIDRTVGEFTSVILLAAGFDGTSPAHEQARALQDRFWADFEHRAFSGVRVLRELARADATTRTSMPVVFTSALGDGEASLGRAAREFGDLTYSLTQTPQVHLDCQVFELGGRLRVNWAVLEELFPPGLIDSAFTAFTTLLQRLADDKTIWNTTHLDLVPPQDLTARHEANNTTAPLPHTLLHQIGGPLRDHGHAPAVITPDRTLTYLQLDQHATRIARHLRNLGARPNTLTAIVMHKGWEQPVATTAVLHSGAAYLPIDATWPPDRINHLLHKGRCQLVLTQTHLAQHHPWPENITVLAVDDENTWKHLDDTPLQQTATPDDLAYVIFTSGSTGQPKGVMIDHKGATNTITDINTRYTLTKNDRVLGLSSLSFDLSVWDIYGPLATGGTLVLPPPDTERDPTTWTKLIKQHTITTWNTVPALMEMLTEHTHTNNETLDTLRLILLSGDWIPLTLPHRINTTAPNAHTISLGGATEASIWSIHHPINNPDPTWRSIPYGRPLTNQAFHILDTDLNPTPTWVPGELFITGTGTAHGYWDDPKKTTERFLTHPHTGQRLYKTGDLGRYHPDGTIEFLGRNDHQVKINGYRIELGEIEAHLTTHPTIKDAIVTTHNNHLTAYLTTNNQGAGNSALAEELRAALEASLPAYMVPHTFSFLDEFPLTPNGKVDRAALPKPLPQTGNISLGESSGPEPRNDIERRLQEIWADVLGIGSVGIHDVFGEVGGDSLLALRVIGKASDAGVSLTPRQFFDHPTIAGLAGVAVLAAPRPEAEPETAFHGEVPLLPAQSMLLAGLREDVARHHNYAVFFELDAPLDKVALRVALRALVTRHDALRTGFINTSQGWRQHVFAATATSATPLAWRDLRRLSVSEQDQAIEESAADTQRSFHLAEPPLIRVLYFDRGPERAPELLLVAHWLVVDNFSLRVLLNELLAAHQQVAEEGEAKLTAPSVATATWAAQTAEYGLRLPGPVPPGAGSDGGYGTVGEAATVMDVLDAARVDRLRAMARGPATVADVLVAAVARAAHAVGFGDSIEVDVDGHGRASVLHGVAETGADLSRTVGRLSVRYPLRIRAIADADEAVRAAAAERAEVANGGLDHALAVYGSGARDQGPLAPAADFAFNFLGAVDELYAICGWRPSQHHPGVLTHPETPLRHRFEILCGTVGGELLVGVTCGEADRPVAERMLKHLTADPALGTAESTGQPASAGRGEGDQHGRAVAEMFRRWLSPGPVG